MQKLFFILLLAFSTAVSAQYNVRPLDSLINKEEPAWPVIKGWIDSATNKVQVLPVDTAKAKTALYDTQVTTRSPMGAVIYETGGILVDNGWIRILGSGHAEAQPLRAGLERGKIVPRDRGKALVHLLVADDAIGGFFAINGGKFGFNQGNVYFILRRITCNGKTWRSTTPTSSCSASAATCKGSVKAGAGKAGEKDVPKLSADKSFLFTPALWVRPERAEEQRARKAIPVEEQYKVMMDMRKQLKLE